jgi:RHS repeat-associated protein
MGTVRYTVVDGEVLSELRGGVKRDYVPDPLGSTVALLDSTQTKTDTFQYWPYGESAGRTGTTATPFQYVGTMGYYTDSSGRNYVRARYLDKGKGRWLTEDPIGFSGGDWNHYLYVSCSPFVFVDPSGNVKIIGCTQDQITEIERNFADVCNTRIDLLQNEELKSCLRRQCNSPIFKIECTSRSHCRPRIGNCGYTPGNGFTKIIVLCNGSAFSGDGPSNDCGCLGKTILHEMIHSCNDIGAPDVDGPGPNTADCVSLTAYGPGKPPCPYPVKQGNLEDNRPHVKNH